MQSRRTARATSAKACIAEFREMGAESMKAGKTCQLPHFGCRPGAYGAGSQMHDPRMKDEKTWPDLRKVGRLCYGRKNFGYRSNEFRRRSASDLTVQNEDTGVHSWTAMISTPIMADDRRVRPESELPLRTAATAQYPMGEDQALLGDQAHLSARILNQWIESMSVMVTRRWRISRMVDIALAEMPLRGPRLDVRGAGNKYALDRD